MRTRRSRSPVTWGSCLSHIDRVVQSSLLNPTHVLPHLDMVQKAGIGSSGVLHRILAHKAAVYFMQLSVSSFG